MHIMNKPKNILHRNNFLGIIVPILCLLSIVVVIFGLFNAIVPGVHDINTFFWSKAFHQVFESGISYPKWIPQLWHGFGLPVFYIYNPFFYFAVLGFQLLNIGTIVSIKLVLILSTLSGAYFMYLLAREFMQKHTAFMVTSLFILTPYYISLVYLRGAFPEFLALNLIPLLLWSVTKLFRNIKDYKYLITSIIALSLIILTHNLTGAIALFVLFIYIFYLYFFEKKNNRFLILNGIMLLFSALLTMFYWLPMLINLKYINSVFWVSDNFFFAKNFPTISNLLNLQFLRDIGWMTLGIIPVIILLLGWISYREILSATSRRRILFILILTTFFVFLITTFSDFIWTMFSYIGIFQFPARFIGISILLLAILGGFVLEALIHNIVNRKIIIIFVIITGIVTAIPFLSVKPYETIEDFVLTNDNLEVNNYLNLATDMINDGKTPPMDRGLTPFEYIPRKMDEAKAMELWLATQEEFFDIDSETNIITLNTPAKVTTESGAIDIEIIEDDVFDGEYLINAYTDGVIKINQFEYPTWEIVLDGKLAKIDIIEERAGQFIDVPEGQHNLTIQLIEQSYEKISGYVSLISFGFLLIMFYIFSSGRRAGRKKHK